MRRIRTEKERGSVTIFVAISLVALLTVAALVIDGGTGYTQHRSMQNAADAAAMAGARALDDAKLGGGLATDVDSIVTTIANQNGASGVTCTVIQWDQTAIGPCSAGGNVTSTTASGVKVTVSGSRQTAFGTIAGRSSLTATASAAATIQPLRSSDQPFIMCASWTAEESKQLFRNGHPYYNTAGTFLNANGTVNTTVLTTMGQIPIQGANVAKCGAGAAFKGKKGGTEPIVLGEDSEANNGNGYEQTITDTVLGATPCPSGLGTLPPGGCDILVPIADSGIGNGNDDITMHIVTWTVWHITGNGLGDPKYSATYKANLTQMSSGQGGTGTVFDASTLRVIKLVL